MPSRPRQTLQKGLRSIGRYVPPAATHQADTALSYLAVGRWLHERGMSMPRVFADRVPLWEFAAQDVSDRKTLYLEFGVWKGYSIRHWAGLLRHPESELHGFDTFEGLPEQWNARFGQGAFGVGGELPAIDDGRVAFHKGLIEETLPAWRDPGGFERLVVNIDLDIYSATRTALTWLEPRIVPGTLIYFDEFADRNHELKAFDEYLDRTGQRFEVVGSDPIFARVVFRRLA